ncbi:MULTISPECIES: hypothetical protein [Mycetohabitans]|uniref:Uncharacterized protein n=1 Tax=Mycetohabitans endofungorum TaxID=417203 RepID=A0A2P5K7K5_9BURK|nr:MULTISPECIES: hypothetical protein [Mycetohabitans]PPB82054.1 hypothetical protein B0O95_11421 [Mycetohabitans endofungorum]
MTWSSDPVRTTLANSSQLRRGRRQQFSITESVNFAQLDDALDDDIRHPFNFENHTRSDNASVWTRVRTRSGSPIRGQSRPTRRDEPATVEDQYSQRPPVNISSLSNMFRRLRSPSASKQQQPLIAEHAGTSVVSNAATIQQYLAGLNVTAGFVGVANTRFVPEMNFILSREDELILSDLEDRFASLGEACPEFRHKPSEDGRLSGILRYFSHWLNVKHGGSFADYLRSQPVTDRANIYNPTTSFDLFKNDANLKIGYGYRAKLDRAIKKFRCLLEWERGKQFSQMTGYDGLNLENSSAPTLASDARNIISLRLQMSSPKEKDADILDEFRNSPVYCGTLLKIKNFIRKEFGFDESLSIIRSEADREFNNALEVLFKADQSISKNSKSDFRRSINALRGKERALLMGDYDNLLYPRDKITSDIIYNYCKDNGISLGNSDINIKSLKVFSCWLDAKGFDIDLANILFGDHCKRQVDALMDQYVLDKEIELRFRSDIKIFVGKIRDIENIRSMLNGGAGVHNSVND